MNSSGPSPRIAAHENCHQRQESKTRDKGRILAMVGTSPPPLRFIIAQGGDTVLRQDPNAFFGLFKI